VDRRGHERVGKAIFGGRYMPIVDRLLDDPLELREYGNKHRKISHTWERLDAIRLIVNQVGGDGDLAWVQALCHTMVDYGMLDAEFLSLTFGRRFPGKPRLR